MAVHFIVPGDDLGELVTILEEVVPSRLHVRQNGVGRCIRDPDFQCTTDRDRQALTVCGKREDMLATRELLSRLQQ